MIKNESKKIPKANSGSVGGRIKARREELDMNATRLAEAAKISKSYLHEIENGQTVMPSAEVLFNIAEALSTSMAVLLGKRQDLASPPEGVMSPSLLEYARQANLTEEEVYRLSCIKHRNRQPKTKEDWAFIHEAIKRAVGDGR